MRKSGKTPVEIRIVVISDFLGDFFYGLVRRDKHRRGGHHPLLLNILFRRNPEQLRKQIGKINLVKIDQPA